MTLGFLPAKMNSSRIPGKNLLKDENGDTLITRSAKWLLQFDFLDRIFVSTDDMNRFLLAHDGCEWMNDPRVVTIQRPPKFSDPDLPLIDLYTLAHRTFPDTEYILATQADNPLKPYYDDVVNMLGDVKTNNRDEAFSVDRWGVKTGSLHIIRVSSLLDRKLAYYCRVYREPTSFDVNVPADWERYLNFVKHAGTI